MKDSIQQEGSERKKNDLKICICCLQLIKRIQHQNHLLRRRIHKFVKSQGFYWLVIVLVLLNTMILAIEYHKQPLWLEKFQCKYSFLIIQNSYLNQNLIIWKLNYATSSSK
jgi:hypothetical protein